MKDWGDCGLCGQHWGTRSQVLRKSSRDKASSTREGGALTMPMPDEQEEGGTEKEETMLTSGFSMNWLVLSPAGTVWVEWPGRESGQRTLPVWSGQKTGLKLGVTVGSGGVILACLQCTVTQRRGRLAMLGRRGCAKA